MCTINLIIKKFIIYDIEIHLRTDNPKICIGPQKTPNSHSNLEKPEQNWRYHSPRFQVTLKSCSNQSQYGTGTKTDA